MSPSHPALEVTECPLARDGQVCTAQSLLKQEAWEQKEEIRGLASEVRENTLAIQHFSGETRELRVAIGMTNRTLAERFDPILAELQSRSVTPSSYPPARGEMATGMFELPVQDKIRAVRRHTRITAIPITALISAAITALIASGLMPAFFRWLALIFGG